MNNNIVSNTKTEVTNSNVMNDKDYINCLLECLKNMSTNLNIALNEASNEVLYDKILVMFNRVRVLQREAFELAFSLGWYPLEKADVPKIKMKEHQLSEEIKQLKI